MGSDELDELARGGRANKDRALRANQDRPRDEADARMREAQLRLYGSVSSYVRGWWVVVALVAVFGCSTVFAVALHDPKVEDSADTWGMFGMLVGSMIGFGCWRLRGALGRRAVAQTERWLAARPFAVRGFVEALRGPTEGAASLTFRVAPAASVHRAADAERGYRDPSPEQSPVAPPLDPAWLADVVRGVGGTLRPRDEARCYAVSYEFSSEDSVGSNAHLARWLRRMLRVLELIHAKHRIESVKITGFG